MRKIIILLCLVLSGCATIPSNNKIPPRAAKIEPTITIDQGELDGIIVVFSEAIKNNPNYAGAYYNRAAAYFHKNDYDKSWQDIHKAEALGINVDVKFIELVKKLKKASGRNQ